MIQNRGVCTALQPITTHTIPDISSPPETSLLPMETHADIDHQSDEREVFLMVRTPGSGVLINPILDIIL